MFSIIIPLYNKAPYIRKCMQTIFAQTFTDYEVIVVNDGSTDDSLEQLGALSFDLSEKKPELFEKIRIVEQENQGVSTARNNGVKLARYDYIAFLDADDWWEPSYLEEMKGLIERYPKGGLYSSSYYKVLRGRNIPAVMGVEEGFAEGAIDYFDVYARTMYQPVWTGAAVIRKGIFDAFGGFNPRLKMGEDFDLWYRVALQYPVVLLHKPLAYYNQDVEQASRAIGSKLYQPEEHFLFSNYSAVKNNPGFVRLYEVLAMYGLLSYYLAGMNRTETNAILSTIHWNQHAFKYRLYYLLLPRLVVKWWYDMKRVGARIKRNLFQLTTQFGHNSHTK